MNHRSIKLVIAEDHPVVLHGLVSLLNSQPDFQVLAACENGATALEAIFKLSPNIALLDLRLPVITGLEILDKLSRANLSTRVVILTAFSDDRDVLLAISRGVHGILIKDSLTNALFDCLRRIAFGERCVPPELVRKEVQRQAQAMLIAQSLTFREKEILCLVAKGLSSKALAAQLNISAGTLKLHLHHIYRKMNVSSRSQLMTLARQLV